MTNAFNLDPKQKIYLLAALWLTILLLIIVFIALPLISQIKQDGQELFQKKQDMESFYRDWGALENSQKDYQQTQEELSGLSAFLSRDENLKFIMLAEKIAQATNNQQEVSVVSEETAKGDRETAKFQISLRGKFPDLIKFLIYLENAPYYSNLESLQTQRLAEKETINSGDITTILTVSVFQQ